MNWGAKLRRAHRVATLVIGAQLLIWTFTGFAFSLFDFGRVRGEDDRAPAPVFDVARVRIALDDAARRALAQSPGSSVQKVSARMLLGRPVYAVELTPGGAVLVDAEDGRVRPALSAEEAGAVAQAAHRARAPVASVESVSQEGEEPFLTPPVFRVRLEDGAGTVVFVSPTSGEVVAWRNHTWRTFDALWSLHTLGYVSRESPAHWGLRITGALALLVALSGLGILGIQLRAARIRQKAA
ncbi:PepSY domain-containing protein [Vitiosangium sp. GDMCC 1.1324]|uniref:PepSY domain-containing protein n=1 Tax=Vitiosangium sp. (strain GDMCC 1.1324) TaxID=2138576 RepID=UPI000D3B9634|nr:PepSY domain-containing protein [Vitiosangium sp. GDMCC 1.1324]PTL80196.1 hypothetical protein DAT35_29785 [Vitiosangium sp. GDMCC 1.1324]